MKFSNITPSPEDSFPGHLKTLKTTEWEMRGSVSTHTENNLMTLALMVQGQVTPQQ